MNNKKDQINSEGKTKEEILAKIMQNENAASLLYEDNGQQGTLKSAKRIVFKAMDLYRNQPVTDGGVNHYENESLENIAINAERIFNKSITVRVVKFDKTWLKTIQKLCEQAKLPKVDTVTDGEVGYSNLRTVLNILQHWITNNEAIPTINLKTVWNDISDFISKNEKATDVGVDIEEIKQAEYSKGYKDGYDSHQSRMDAIGDV